MAVLYNSVHFTLLILLLRAKVNDQISWAWDMCMLLEGRFVVVALLFYVHGKHLRSCRDGQLT